MEPTFSVLQGIAILYCLIFCPPFLIYLAIYLLIHRYIDILIDQDILLCNFSYIKSDGDIQTAWDTIPDVDCAICERTSGTSGSGSLTCSYYYASHRSAAWRRCQSHDVRNGALECRLLVYWTSHHAESTGVDMRTFTLWNFEAHLYFCNE